MLTEQSEFRVTSSFKSFQPNVKLSYRKLHRLNGRILWSNRKSLHLRIRINQYPNRSADLVSNQR